MGDALVFSVTRLRSSGGGRPLGAPDRDLPGQGVPKAPLDDPLGIAGRRPPEGAASSRSGTGGGGSGGGGLKAPLYLGECFAAAVVAFNRSDRPVAALAIQVELAAKAAAAMLHDSSSQPLPSLQPGQRHEFTVKHDIKELGAHTLTCTASYVGANGERHVQGQAFPFFSLNPLVVRTKQRHVAEAVLLEATLENATKAPMQLDAVSFLPSPAYTAEHIGSGASSSGGPSGSGGSSLPPASGEAHKQSLPLIPEGCAFSFIFCLLKAPPPPSSSPTLSPAAAAAFAAAEASGALGKIEIRWRGPTGEAARLQTQQIRLPQQEARDVSLALARLPARVVVGAPFTAAFTVQSHVDRRLGPLQLAAAVAAEQASPGASPGRTPSSGSDRGRSGEGAGGTGAAATAAAVCLDGAESVLLAELAPRQATEMRLRLLALAAGQQALPALALTNERDGRLYAFLPPVELFVDSA